MGDIAEDTSESVKMGVQVTLGINYELNRRQESGNVRDVEEHGFFNAAYLQKIVGDVGL